MWKSYRGGAKMQFLFLIHSTRVLRLCISSISRKKIALYDFFGHFLTKCRHLRKLNGKVTRPGVLTRTESRSRSRNYMILILVTINRKLTAEIDIDYVLFSYTGSEMWSILIFCENQNLD